MGMANLYRGPCKVKIRANALAGVWITSCAGCGDWCTFTYWPEAIIRAQKHARRQARLASW